MESGIQFKESEIPLTIGIQNPSFTDKYWDTVHGIRNPRRGIQNSRLSWIPFHEAMSVFSIRGEDSYVYGIELNFINVHITEEHIKLNSNIHVHTNILCSYIA